MEEDLASLTLFEEPKLRFIVSCQVLLWRKSPNRQQRRLMQPSSIPVMLVVIIICSVLLTALHAIYRPPHVLIQYLQHRWPDVLFHVSTKQKLVVLTIDDAPSEHTRSLLEIIQASGAAATFFIIGSQVPGCEHILQEIIATGSELGNHTMHDVPSRSLSDAELRSQMQDVDVMINQAYTASNKEAPKYFRPGSGFFSTRMRSSVQSMGSKLVLGNVYPHDPQIRFWRINAWHVLSMVRRGGIIICHDRRSWTAPMLRKVLPEIRKGGFRVVTLTELLKAGGG